MSDDAIDKMKAQKVLAVCMPLHDGKLCWETWFQLREEEKLFDMLNMGWRIDPIVVAGCSLITRARNEAVANALERGAEAVMWIDGDMNWTGGAIARLLSMDKDIVAAACPLKQAETKWNVRFLPGDVKRGENGLIEVETVGTGFMFTKRRVYEIMADRLGDEFLYDHPDGEGRRVGYFQAPQNWGEDSWFCKQWRELCGGKVWVDPAITIQHVIAPSWSVKACLGAWLDEAAAAREPVTEAA